MQKPTGKEDTQPEESTGIEPGTESDTSPDTQDTEDSAVSPFATLGAQIWFNIPVTIGMLLLGAFAMPSAISLDMSHTALYARALLGIYASGVALNVLDALVGRTRRSASSRVALPWRGQGTTAVYNFLLDAVYVIGIVALDKTDEPAVIITVFTLTGIRFLAQVAGQPWPLLGGKRVPIVALPATLPFIFLALQGFYTPNGQLAGPELYKETALLAMVLPMAYAILAILNNRLIEEAELAEAVAERDRKLRESQKSAELDAKRLAEQVLRLDLLQNGIRAINSAIELEDLLQMIVNNAVRVLKAEQSSIGLVDPVSGELAIQCATGLDSAKLHRRRFRPGVGVAGWVVQNGKPLMVEDVRLDVRYVDPYTDESIGRTTRSMLCVPLVAEGKVIGTLCVTHSEPSALDQEDQNLLTAFAEQAALAVHKSQLLDERTRQSEELRRRGEIITSLHSIGQSVLSSLDLPQVLSTVISRMSELTAFDDAMIYLVNERTGDEELVAHSNGKMEHYEALGLVPGTRAMELWEKALETGTVQSCDEGMCMICLPLVNRGRPIGCIILARQGTTGFSDIECDTAEKVAHAATLAIVNARLFSRVSLAQQQTTSLYRLMLKVNTASNRKQLSHVICQELRQITGARASALLINDGAAHITCWASSGEWTGIDFSSLSLPAQGHHFVAGILTALHQMESPGLLIVHNVPHEIALLTGSASGFTIPLAQAGRIYGLLVVEPSTPQPIPDEIRETVSLAVSHSTVALERSELFEQTLAAARQSSMLYSIAAEIQTSLDQHTVVQMTVNGALEALPVRSCELYLFDEDHRRLRRAGLAVSPSVSGKDIREGPENIIPDDNPTLVEVLRSPGLVVGDIVNATPLDGADSGCADASPDGTCVVLGRLMGSEDSLGILRLTTTVAAEEFVQRHATFCQTLLTHSGGALERSRLYTTASSQAQMLRQRAQQLTDILDLGSLSAADVPFPTLMPRIAAGIARSLGVAYVRIGEVGEDSSDSEVWAAAGVAPHGEDDRSSRALSIENLETLMDAGRPLAEDISGAYLDERMLAELVPGETLQEGVDPYPLVLMPLRSTGGEIQGYILAALREDIYTPETTERDLLEVLSIFSQRIALIIENHRIYSQLLDSKRKMEAVVLSISDGVIVTDSELSILINNSLAGRLLGAHTSTGTPTMHLPWLLHNDDLITMLRKSIADSDVGSMDVDLALGRDLRTYQAVVHPITAPGMGVLGSVLTLRDVTAERATERAKSDFLSIVSHELRTPLNSVMGFLDIILMGKTGPLTDLQNDFLTTAKQEAVVLQHLINDVLDYSQLQSGMFRMEMAPLNLSSVISRVVNQAVPRMDRDELTLINNVPTGLVVVGDEIRLEQVFKNLVDNAAKFTDAGGSISLNCEVEHDTVTISVKDTGCGIPPAQVADVFSRFFQAENNSSRQKHQRGLGLGLAICKNIVEAHGGRIWIESELGEGTTVSVELLLFDPNSDLYDFDEKTGKATLATPVAIH